MSPRAHRNEANSALVRCSNAMKRIKRRRKKLGLPAWHTLAEMDADAKDWRYDIGIPTWNEHRRDLELLVRELGHVHYPGEVP